MSVLNEFKSPDKFRRLLSLTRNIVDKTFLTNIDDTINLLIQKLPTPQLKDVPNLDSASVNLFCETFESLKLILDLIVWQIEQESFVCPPNVTGNLLQCVRDVLDLSAPEDIVKNALELLIEICKLCAKQSCQNSIRDLVQFYLYHLHLVQHNTSEINVRLRLRILNGLLDTVANSFTSDSLQVFRDQCQLQNDTVVESRLFVKIIFELSDSISAQALFTVLPLYAQVFDSPSIYTIIWNEALNIQRIELNIFKHFTALCYLFDKFAPKSLSGNLENFSRVLQNEDFWITVQYGLTYSDNVIRRQALYLLKRSIQEMFNGNLTLFSHKLNEISGNNFAEQLDGGLIKLSNGMKNFTICSNKMFLVSTDQQNIMWWHADLRDELLLLFNDIFLVLETLEEKQSHIVKPIFHTLIRLLGPTVCPFRNGKCLHISWLLVIFQRILQHDNAAVVRWGLLNLMEIDLDFFLIPSLSRNIIKLFVSHLNDQGVYANELELIRSKLKIFFDSAAESNISKLFFQILIEEICLVSWSPEALFLVLDALQDVKVVALEANQLSVLKKFVSISIASHYTFLRASIQCHLINIIINMTDASLVNLESLADLLSVFRGQECFKRGSETWNAATKWLGFCYSKRNAEDYIVSNFRSSPQHSTDLRIISRMVCLLYDAHLFGLMPCCGEVTSINISATFDYMLATFTDSDKRLYASPTLPMHNLEIISGILKETIAERSSLIEVMIKHFGSIVAFILSRCRVLNDIKDYETAKLFIETYKYILKAQNTFKIQASAHVNEVYTFSLDSLGISGPATVHPLLSFVSMNFLRLILENVYSDDAVPKLKYLQKHFKKHVNAALEKTDGDVDTAHIWGRMNGEFLEAQWYIIGRLKSENILIVGKEVRVEQFMTPTELGEKCVCAMSLGGSDVLKAVLRTAEDVLPELADADVEVLIHTAWTALYETRRSEAFHDAARHFISLLFQQEIVKRPNLYQIGCKYGEILLSDNIHGLANRFLMRIQALKIKYTLNPLWEHILSIAVLFGNSSRREDRLTIEVCNIISSTPCAANNLVNNDWKTSSEVRARALQILLSLSRVTDTHTAFADAISDALMVKEGQLNGSKVRTFDGSAVHLFLTRILQTLLIIEPLLSKDKRLQVYNWSCELLMKGNHQPSVRYMAEWLIVRILWLNPELHDSLWLLFTEALERRIGNLCSFISIVFHTIAVLPEYLIEAWIDRAFLQFLPYCSAQHFSLRLYAQVAIEKMWEKAIKLKLERILKKYEIMHQCQLRAVINGNALLNADKLRQDFYWTVFDPLKHYSLQTILRDLPRLAHIKSDEWITPELLQKVGVCSEVYVPWSSGEELWLHPIAKWTVRNEESSIEAPIDNYQKKMIPVKSLLPDYEQLFSESASAFSRKQQSFTDGLIVVASLIDRAANLGGLSRTCEAFGVSQLVVDSLKIIEDKQFQSLSVSSEKWVSITEIKIHYLTEYLLKMKSEGYIVVGAEQTSRSQPLPKCKFPQRSLLLLGSEKEGIPPNLLPLLDICVEVPQLGVIRSLNVHVTAALFIWEYAKQHAFAQI